MAVNINIGPDGEDDELVASINTTPLVDIMLVLLIIFLITIPVVTHTVPVALPHETNQPTKTRPDNIIIAVDKAGNRLLERGADRRQRGASRQARGARHRHAAARGPYPRRQGRAL